MIHVNVRNTYYEKQLSKKDSRLLSEFLSSIKSKTKPYIDKCFICGKEHPIFCSSHSLPKFVLKNIANDGKLKTANHFMSDPHSKLLGVNETLLFKLLCAKCDSTFFQEYENEEAFQSKLSDIAINEIALKTNLRRYYKRQFEYNFYHYIKEMNEKKRHPDKAYNQMCENRLMTISIDLSDEEKRIKKYVKGKNKHNFYVIDEIDLDYKTELAFQGYAGLKMGYDGLINDIYNYDPNNYIQLLYICVFPYTYGTKIVLFCEDGAKKMKHFYKHYRELSLSDRLKTINLIILLYNEEWVVSSDFDDSNLNEKTLKIINLSDDANLQVSQSGELKTAYKLREELVKTLFDLGNTDGVYNFLENHNYDSKET